MRLPTLSRPALLRFALSALPAALLPPLPSSADGSFAYQPALVGKDYGKSEMSYKDFSQTPGGTLFKDAKIGKGPSPVAGDRVVIDCIVTLSG